MLDLQRNVAMSHGQLAEGQNSCINLQVNSLHFALIRLGLCFAVCTNFYKNIELSKIFFCY